MNNTKIYYAQLDVSKYFTVETITNLINRLSYLGKDVYYSNETRSIDIELQDGTWLFDESKIRNELKHWVNELPAEEESIKTICDNINYVFNITQIAIGNNVTVKVYLY